MVMMVVVVGTKVAAVEVVKVLVDDIEEVVVTCGGRIKHGLHLGCCDSIV